MSKKYEVYSVATGGTVANWGNTIEYCLNYIASLIGQKSDDSANVWQKDGQGAKLVVS